MGPDRNGRRQPGEESAGDLAAAILCRIADGDLPAGLELQPERMAAVFHTTAQMAAQALEQLEDAGATVRIGDSWMVRTDREPDGRELLNRAGPLLRAMTSLAAQRITATEAAGLLAAYDRFAGFAGDGSAPGRADGYRLFMERLAEASGSRFHAMAVKGLLAETSELLDRVLAHKVQESGHPEPEDALARLARGLMAGDTAAVSDALEDHLIIIGRHLDCAANS